MPNYYWSGAVSDNIGTSGNFVDHDLNPTPDVPGSGDTVTLDGNVFPVDSLPGSGTNAAEWEVNSDAINGGTFNGLVVANVEISGGTYNSEVQANANINAGTFNAVVTSVATITGGTFGPNSQVIQNGLVAAGTFNGEVINSGEIDGGTFGGALTNNGSLFGGTVSGSLRNNGTIDGPIVITGRVSLDDGEHWAYAPTSPSNPTLMDPANVRSGVDRGDGVKGTLRAKRLGRTLIIR